MNCPKCGEASKVLRSVKASDGVFRHRECKSCKQRFYTTENTALTSRARYYDIVDEYLRNRRKLKSEKG
jgi:transcriptional regulator NrdR family protein